MNKADFAAQLARIAQKSAGWSADYLQPNSSLNQSVTLETVLWFTNDVRAALDKMEKDAAITAIAASRLAASKYKQLGFLTLSAWHRDNAHAAEKWLIRAGKLYPQRCPA